MHENEISGLILNSAIKVHAETGPGLLESVYEELLSYELKETYGLRLERQKGLPVYYNGLRMELGFRADIIVENKVIIEIKSVEALAQIHYKQLLTYLKLTNYKLGLLINFNEVLLKNGYHRIVNNL